MFKKKKKSMVEARLEALHSLTIHASWWHLISWREITKVICSKLWGKKVVLTNNMLSSIYFFKLKD